VNNKVSNYARLLAVAPVITVERHVIYGLQGTVIWPAVGTVANPSPVQGMPPKRLATIRPMSHLRCYHAILSHDFVVQPYCVTKLQHATVHVAHFIFVA